MAVSIALRLSARLSVGGEYSTRAAWRSTRDAHDRDLVHAGSRGVLTATLNRADKRNAIDTAMIDALLAALERADLDAGVRVVAVRGHGRDFCAGMDLNELLASADHTLELNRQAALHFAQVFCACGGSPSRSWRSCRAARSPELWPRRRAISFWRRSRRREFGYPEVQRGFVPAIVMTMLRRALGETDRLRSGARPGDCWTEPRRPRWASRRGSNDDARFRRTAAASAARNWRKRARRRWRSPNSNSINWMG